MFTPIQIKDLLQSEALPNWIIKNGSVKIMEYKGENLSESVDKFENFVSKIDVGTYNVYASQKAKNDGGGGFSWTMRIGNIERSTPNQLVYQQTNVSEEQAERNLFLRQLMPYGLDLVLLSKNSDALIMLAKNSDMLIKLLSKVEKIAEYLNDSDNDGTPDVFQQMAETGKEMAASTAKKAASKYMDKLFD